MTAEDRERRIRDILSRTNVIGSAALALSPHADLWKQGLDSLGYVHLIVVVEDEWDIEFPTEMMVPETFRTISTITGAIASLSDGR